MALLADKPSTELMLQIESCHDYKGIMIKYVEYTKCTLSGKHGNTARLWMTYVKLVDIYLRLTGIAAFSYSDPARRRWMLTRGARSGIVGGLFEKAGLKTAEDVSKSLRPHRIKKDHEDLKKIMDGISNTMNPLL